MSQPNPKQGQEDVTEALVAELRERSAKGIATYGRPLETFNGRDPGQDAQEEWLDLGKYLKQVRMERDAALAALRKVRGIFQCRHLEVIEGPEQWAGVLTQIILRAEKEVLNQNHLVDAMYPEKP